MNNTKSLKQVSGVVFLLSLLALSLSAQVSKGSMSGLVVDPTGAVVPGAEVSVVSTETNQVFSNITDKSGAFNLQLLPVGTYRVSISRAGFRKTTIENVVVNTGADRSMGTLKLELGAVTDTVEVTTAAPLVTATEAQISTTFSSHELTTIAGIQENNGLDNLAILLPGVNNVRDQGFSNTNGAGFSVDGLRGRSNDQQIDGQNNNDNSVAGPGVFLSNTEFVDSYDIKTSNFGPEYGRNSGSVVNIITKQGSNRFHGALVVTEGNSALNALSSTQKRFEGLTKLPRSNNQFSTLTLGGPIVKDKLFFFAGFDDQIISQKATYTSNSLTPTPTGLTQLATCYPGSASVAALQNYGPYGITVGNPQPLGTPTIETLNDANGNPFCNVEFNGITRTTDNSYRQYDYIGRVDYIRSKDTIYGRYLYQTSNSFLNGDNGAAGNLYDVPATGTALSVSWTRKFSDRMINELRFNYGKLKVDFGGGTEPLSSQLDTAAANITIRAPGFLGYGPATNLPQGRAVTTYQVQDNWTFVTGVHTLKAGVNYSDQQSTNNFLPNLNGQYRFADFSAYALNVPNRVRISLGTPHLNFVEHDTFVYFGDDWRIKKNLTLNLGLTYSYYGQPANLFHDLTTKRESSSTPLFNPALPLSVRTFPELPAVKNSFGPSVGFAYSPSGGKTIFRGGYRLTYDPAYYNIYLNIASSAPQVLANTLTGSLLTGVTLPAVPTGPNNRASLSSFLQTGVADPRAYPLTETQVSPDFKPDRVQGWSFGIQRELSSELAFEVRYVGNHADRQFQTVNGNPDTTFLTSSFPNLLPAGVTPCATPPATNPGVVGRTNCNTASVLRLRTNTGFSDYNGLQTEIRANQLARQLTMKANFTWSKTTDNASEIFSTFAGGNSSAFSQNPFDNTKGEHGVSGLDFPKNFTISAYEALPFFRNQTGFVGRVLGGWAVAGTYILSSGQAYTPIQAFANQALGGCGGGGCGDALYNGTFAGIENLRPFLGNPGAPVNSVGIYAADGCGYFGLGCQLAPTQLISFNAANASGTETQVDKSQVRYILNGPEANTVYGTPFGNVPRNYGRDAITNSMNLTVYKNLKITERVNFQFHASALNALNHGNANSIDPFIEDAGLALETTGFADSTLFSGGARSLAFGVKITF